LLWRAVLALAFLLAPSFAWGAQLPDAGAARTSGRRDGKAAKTTDKADKKAKQALRYAPVELFQINTKETLKLRFFDDRGKPVKGWQKKFDKFMRCHQTGAVGKMDPRLARMLYEIGRHFDGHRLEVVSGYRHPKVAKNPKSPHKQGLACDFRVQGIANSALRDYLRKTLEHAGVGYYPNSVFVHLDDRKQGPSAFWVDCAGPGEAASYAENPREGLRNGGLCTRPSGGGSEGEDDMAQAGEAGLPASGRAKTGNNSGFRPVEVKAPTNTFGD
jgi:uncharacterized protein YcbK (DUF882 family)